MAVRLVPNYKDVLTKSYVVWVGIAGTLFEVATWIAANIDLFTMTDAQKSTVRIVLGLLIIVLRPIQQKSLHQPPTERSES